MQDVVEIEKYLSQRGITYMYPITIMKHILNRPRILGYFTKAAAPDFEIRGPQYDIDNHNCELCVEKSPMLCRAHTSLKRIMEATTVCHDLDTNAYLVQNEIFRVVDDKLVMIYCPHPKLITGDLTNSAVKKINTITIPIPDGFVLPGYKEVQILSSELMTKNLKCWFNPTFSIISHPNGGNNVTFSLVLNR